jgi:hypothetical protein
MGYDNIKRWGRDPGYPPVLFTLIVPDSAAPCYLLE